MLFRLNITGDLHMNNSERFTFLSLTAVIVLSSFMFVSTPVLAQHSDELVLEEVTVTARKRV